MKLVYGGIFKNNEQLPKGELPENAVKFVEPNDMTMVMLVAMIFAIPAGLLIIGFMAISHLLHGEVNARGSLVGVAAAILAILPHELLHAVAFGKSAEVTLFLAPKQFAAFVTSTHPVTKARFIFMSLLPNLVFGFIPLSVWTVLPYNEAYSPILFSFSVLMILCGVGDYMNVFNAARQMPKGSLQQLSGINSYWFMP
jgi:hypothetical protein